MRRSFILATSLIFLLLSVPVLRTHAEDKSISVFVKQVDGEAITDAEVTLRGRSFDEQYVQYTDSNGQTFFVLEDVEDNILVEVEAEKQGYEPNDKKEILVESLTEIHITLLVNDTNTEDEELLFEVDTSYFMGIFGAVVFSVFMIVLVFYVIMRIGDSSFNKRKKLF